MANLIGRWNLNGTIDDISGSGRHGTLLGAPSISTSEGIIKSECYEFNSVGKYCILPSEFLPYCSDWSVSFFVKFNSAQISYNSPIKHLPGGYQFFTTTDQKMYFKSVNDNTQVEFFNGIALNRWYHICFRSNNNKIDIFLDGTKTISNYSTPNANTSIEKDFYVGSYTENNNTRFQDFRVYDGLLSDKEIYDLSKALVLKYDFEDVEEPTVNLFPVNIRLMPIRSGTYSSWELYKDSYDNIIYKFNRVNEVLYEYNGFDTSVIVGDKYTLSLDVYVSTDYDRTSGMLVRLENAISSVFELDNSKKGMWQKAVITGVCSTTILRTLLYPSPDTASGTKGYILYRNPQLEKKDHATPFVNGTRDNIIVRDKSEYGNDSLPLTTVTTPGFVDDCKVGKLGTSYSVFKDDYITLPNLGVKDKYSISFWAYKNNASGMPFGTLHGQTFYWHGTSSYQYTHGGTSGEWYYNNGDTINNWNHYVVTYDGTKVEVFINSVSKGTKSSSGSAVLNALCIGSSFTTPTDTTYYSTYKYTGKLDDFRIYATALSSADVLDIYQSRANLDNKGNLSVVSLNQQGATSISLTEKGVYNTVEISEVGVTEGLIAWYPLNGDAKDYSGNGNDGTVVGATVAAGQGQKCYQFDGVDDYIPTNFKQNVLIGDFTVSLWCKLIAPVDGSSDGIYGGHDFSASYKGFGLQWYQNSLHPFYGDGTSWKGWQQFTSNDTIYTSWFKIDIIYKPNSSISKYINGILIEQKSCFGLFAPDVTFDIGIANRTADRYTNGKIQDVRIYNRALTPEEVLINYNLTKADKTAMIQAENGTTYVNKIKEV